MGVMAMVEIPAHVIAEALARLEARAVDIKSIIYATPMKDLIELRKEAIHLLRGKTADEILALHSELAMLREKEKPLLHLLKLQKKSSELTLELVGVDMQIDEFKRELFLLGANTELLLAMNKGT